MEKNVKDETFSYILSNLFIGVFLLINNDYFGNCLESI